MIVGPIVLVVFLVSAGITYAITRDWFKSLGIGGAIAAVPIGAYFGGFFGALIAAFLGFSFGIGLPFLIVVAAYLGFFYVVTMQIARFVDAIGLPFLVIPAYLLVWFGSVFAFLHLLGSRVSAPAQGALGDEAAEQVAHQAKLKAARPQPGVEQAARPDADPLRGRMKKKSTPNDKLRLQRALFVIIALVGGWVLFVMTVRPIETGRETRAAVPPAAPSRPAPKPAAPQPGPDDPEPPRHAAAEIPHFSSLLGKRAAAADAWCAAQNGKWHGEWGGAAWRRCEFAHGWLTGQADDAQSILTGVMLHRPMAEQERRELLDELSTKYGSPAEFKQSTGGFVLARWDLPGGTTVTYRELGPHGASVAWTLSR